MQGDYVGKLSSSSTSHPDFLINLSQVQLRTDPSLLLGRGGSASVYRGKWRGLPCAAKVMSLQGADVKAVEFMVRELRFLMELLDATAADYAYGSRSNQLSLIEIIQLGVDIFEAISYLHFLGIVHRDIKPANVLLDFSKRGKLADMGLAPNMSQSSKVSGSQSTSSQHFMAPEQWQIKCVPTSKVDIYSGAATILALIAKCLPYEGMNGSQIMKALLVQEMACPQLETVTHAGLRSLLQQCMSLNPLHRPEVSQVLETLERILRELQGKASVMGTTVDITAAQAEMKAAKEERDKARSERDLARKETVGIRADLEAARSDCAVKARNIKELEEQIATYVTHRAKEKQELRKSRDQVVTELNVLKAEIESLRYTIATQRATLPVQINPVAPLSSVTQQQPFAAQQDHSSDMKADNFVDMEPSVIPDFLPESTPAMDEPPPSDLVLQYEMKLLELEEERKLAAAADIFDENLLKYDEVIHETRRKMADKPSQARYFQDALKKCMENREAEAQRKRAYFIGLPVPRTFQEIDFDISFARRLILNGTHATNQTIESIAGGVNDISVNSFQTKQVPK